MKVVLTCGPLRGSWGPPGSTEHAKKYSFKALLTIGITGRQISRLTVPSHLYWILVFLFQNANVQHSLFKENLMIRMQSKNASSPSPHCSPEPSPEVPTRDRPHPVHLFLL